MLILDEYTVGSFATYPVSPPLKFLSSIFSKLVVWTLNCIYETTKNGAIAPTCPFSEENGF